MQGAPHTIFRDDLFAGQVAIVTGGGSGIGLTTAEELGRLGARLVLGGRRRERLEEGVAHLAERGIEAISQVVDIRDEEQVGQLIEAPLARWGRLDLLFNNAGGQFPSPAQAIRSKGWRAVVDVNLNGTFQVCREAFNRHMEANGGAIVNMVADMWRGFPGMAHTGAARAGVVNMTRSLAVEWARAGVRVNAVAPGVIYSSGVQTYDAAFQQLFMESGSRNPTRRLGTMEEVSAAVVFLLSPAASYITGDTLRVDGGSSLWGSLFPVAEHAALPPFAGRVGPEP